MEHLNDWEHEKIIHEDKIKCIDFLREHEFITEIEEGYYYLNTPAQKVEELFYKEQLARAKQDVDIENIELEYKRYMDKLHHYNEVKDVLAAMVGQIAENRNVPVKEIYEEIEIDLKE